MTDISKYETIKNEGNALFKQKNLNGALEKFQEGVKLITGENDNLQKLESQDPLIKLYLQILTNKALCELNLGKNEHVIETTQEVLKLDINNPKALYRFSLAKRNLAEQILSIFNNNFKMIPFDSMKKIESYYEDSRFQMEILSKLEPHNKSVKNELSEIVKNQVRIKLQYRELKKTNPELFKDENKNKEQKKNENNEEEEEEEVAINFKKSEKDNTNRRIVNQLDTNELKQISEMAVKQNTDSLLKGEKLPESASIFEKNISAFKTLPEKLYSYLLKIPKEHFGVIYKAQDIPVEVLFQIINTISEYGTNQENRSQSLQILEGVSQTNKFSLCMMCTTRKEKEKIKALFEKLEASQDLFKAFKL